MRIALIITELFPGGAEKTLVNLALFLKARGHEVCVWQIWPEPSSERAQMVDMLKSADIACRSCNARSARKYCGAILKLRREIRSFRPDVVQSFLFHANFACAGAMWSPVSQLFRTRRKKPVFFGGARVRQPQRSRGILQAWAARGMEKLICVSEQVAEHCRAKERIPRQKITVIPNGIDVAKMDAAPSADWPSLGIPKDAEVVLCVGRLDEQKSTLELIENSPLFLRSLPNAHLVLMGEGPLREAAERQSAESEFRERIHLVGWQPSVASWMRAAQLVILAAKYEGMPNAILEAMAMKKPIVTFRIDGIEELLASDTKQTVAPQDYHAFADAINAIMKSPEIRQQLGTGNRMRIEADFQLANQLRKYELLYQNAVQMADT